jgi:hypothetical protein
MAKVDIVIPFVDGAVPGYEAYAIKYTNEYVPCHVRTLGELRYTLRSIAKYANWANVILVVQDLTHVPAWVDASQLRIVLHRDYIPEKLLPTFHWATIVAHMHLIPGLANHFIIWEDDIVLGRKISDSDFFSPHRQDDTLLETFPIIPGLEKFLGTYQRNLSECRALLRRRVKPQRTCFLYPHIPMPVFKPYWDEYFDLFSQDSVFSDTIQRRSRGDEIANPTIDPIVVFNNWKAMVKGKHSTLYRYWRISSRYLKKVTSIFSQPMKNQIMSYGSYAIVNDIQRMKKHMIALRREQPVFMNINDEAYDDWAGGSRNINPLSVKLLIDTLEQLFPTQSRFEQSFLPA